MSQIHIRRSTPSPNGPGFKQAIADHYEAKDTYDAAVAFESTLQPDSFTESRAVVQQFSANDGTLENMFTMEMSRDNDKIILKSFDPDRVVIIALTYDTAVALYEALSDHLDTLEANVDNVLSVE